jgi:hypothetical protein
VCGLSRSHALCRDRDSDLPPGLSAFGPLLFSEHQRRSPGRTCQVTNSSSSPHQNLPLPSLRQERKERQPPAAFYPGAHRREPSGPCPLRLSRCGCFADGLPWDSRVRAFEQRGGHYGLPSLFCLCVPSRLRIGVEKENPRPFTGGGHEAHNRTPPTSLCRGFRKKRHTTVSHRLQGPPPPGNCQVLLHSSVNGDRRATHTQRSGGKV